MLIINLAKNFQIYLKKNILHLFKGKLIKCWILQKKQQKPKTIWELEFVIGGGDWLPVKGAGWGEISSTKSSWSNQALFTYEGVASPTLAAMKTITQG